MGVTTSAAASFRPAEPFLRPAEPVAGGVRAGRGIEVVVTARCQGCGACLLTCPAHAIRPAHAAGPVEEARAGRPAGRQTGARTGARTGAPVGPLIVLDSLCTGCGECVEVCPVDAIEDHRLDTSTTGHADESMNVPGNGSDT